MEFEEMIKLEKSGWGLLDMDLWEYIPVERFYAKSVENPGNISRYKCTEDNSIQIDILNKENEKGQRKVTGLKIPLNKDVYRTKVVFENWVSSETNMNSLLTKHFKL